MSSDEEFMRPFVEATENIFTTMLGMALTWKRTYVKTDNKAFAVILNGTAGSEAPRAFLDDITSALASCGCS